MANDDTTATLQAEVATLKQRLAENVTQHAALRENQALLEAVVENNPGGISVMSRDRHILLVNHVVEGFFARDRAQLVGKPIAELVRPEVIAAWDVSDQL